MQEKYENMKIVRKHPTIVLRNNEETQKQLRRKLQVEQNHLLRKSDDRWWDTECYWKQV